MAEKTYMKIAGIDGMPTINGACINTWQPHYGRYETFLYSGATPVTGCTLSQPMTAFDSILVCVIDPNTYNEGGQINEFPLSSVKAEKILGHLHTNLGAGGNEYWYGLVCSSNLNDHIGVIGNYKKMLKADYTSNNVVGTTTNYGNLKTNVISYVKGVIYQCQ